MLTGFLPGDGGSPTDFANAAPFLAFVSLLIFPAWFVGRLVRERGQRADAFAELAEQAAIEQRDRDAAAIAQERVRIGTELQDIIAHSVSAMVIQAGGARSAAAKRSRPGPRVDPQRRADRPRGARRSASPARDAAQGRRPASARPAAGLGPALARCSNRSARPASICELRTEGDARRPDTRRRPGRPTGSIEAALQLPDPSPRPAAVLCHVDYRTHELELEIRGDGSIPDVDEELRQIAQRVALYDGSLRSLPVGRRRVRGARHAARCGVVAAA